jgi:organic radical activating enzyme
MTTLRVSRMPGGEPEIFHSLQGEGTTLGIPSVFLRLATCNLRCAWCDTKYTWDWEHYDYEREVLPLPIEEVEQRILSYRCPHLVITGGEPLLQQRQLLPLCSSLKGRGFYLEVETNGTLQPGQELAGLIDQWNVSPKTSNSGNSQEAREVSPALRALASLPTSYFKFVVDTPQDLQEVMSLRERYHVPKERLFLMPQATTPEELVAKGRWLADICRQGGFRFTTRLHILLWGDKRGA